MLPWTIRRWLGLADPEEETGVVDAAPFQRPPNVAYNHELAMALVQNRDDDRVYEAYAAWLTENNDPRGTLILTMLSTPSALPDAAHLAQFLGPLFEPDVPWASGLSWTWERGFLATVSVDAGEDGAGLAELVSAVLTHPSALVLRSLTVRCGRVESLVDALADGPVLPLQRLVVDALSQPLGTWAPVWSRLPSLQSLRLAGRQVQLGAISLPELKELRLEGTLPDAAVSDLIRMNTPKLESLDLPVGQDATQLRERFADALDRESLSFS